MEEAQNQQLPETKVAYRYRHHRERSVHNHPLHFRKGTEHQIAPLLLQVQEKVQEPSPASPLAVRWDGRFCLQIQPDSVLLPVPFVRQIESEPEVPHKHQQPASPRPPFSSPAQLLHQNRHDLEYPQY